MLSNAVRINLKQSSLKNCHLRFIQDLMEFDHIYLF